MSAPDDVSAHDLVKRMLVGVNRRYLALEEMAAMGDAHPSVGRDLVELSKQAAALSKEVRLYESSAHARAAKMTVEEQAAQFVEWAKQQTADRALDIWGALTVHVTSSVPDQVLRILPQLVATFTDSRLSALVQKLTRSLNDRKKDSA
jgi:hypothetical protein